MMRTTTIALVWMALACGDGTAAKPTAASLGGMSVDDQCKAVAPRLQPCLNDLVVSTAAATGIDPEMAAAMAAQLEASDRKESRKRRDPDEARDEIVAFCISSATADPGYTQRVLTCWDEKTCPSLAACVTR